MLDVWDTLDLAEDDPELAAYRARYLVGEYDVETLERAIDERLHELQHSNEYRARPSKADIDADIRRQTQKAEAKRRLDSEKPRTRRG